jgi:PncC family amidohydrolase
VTSGAGDLGGDDALGRAVGAALTGRTLAVAESFTGGALTQRLVAVPGSGEWMRGGVVAYHPEVKFGVLGVRRGPVVSRVSAEQMAAGVARALGADAGLATTGVAGPEPIEGEAVGTVWVGWTLGGRTGARRFHLDGDPETVCARGVEQALTVLLGELRPADHAEAEQGTDQEMQEA